MKIQQLKSGAQSPFIRPVINCKPRATAGFKQPVDIAKCREKNKATAIVNILKNWFGVKSVLSLVTIRIVHTKTKVPIASDAVFWKKMAGVSYI